jgi:hypothetical protein
MKKILCSLAAILLAACFLFASPVYSGILEPDANKAQHASAGQIAGDLLLIRPVTLGLTIIGTGLFIVTSPFTLAGGNFTHSAEVFVVEPATYTFGYPLGSY